MRDQIVLLVHLEGIRQAQASKWNVITFPEAMESGLNVNGRNVVGQQDNFVGVNLVTIFVFQLFRGHQAKLHQAGDERPRSGERVDDVNVFIPDALIKLLPQNIIHRTDNKIHHLHRGVDNPQPLGNTRESPLEEFVVQPHDQLLFGKRIGQPQGTAFNIVIEPVQGFCFLIEMAGFQYIQHALHRDRHLIAFHKFPALEQGFKYRTGNQMLRQHLNHVFFGHAAVQIITQFCQKLIKLPSGRTMRIIQCHTQACHVPPGNSLNVLRPVFPVMTRATFSDDLRHDRLAELINKQGRMRDRRNRNIRCNGIPYRVGVLLFG